MVRSEYRLRDSDECLSNGLQSTLGARLSRPSKLLSARKAVKTAKNSEQKAVLERKLFATVLTNTVDAHSTELLGLDVGHSPQHSTVLVLVCS